MSTLLLLLPAGLASAASEYLYVESSDGTQAERSGQAVATLLPAAGRAGQIVAVVAHQQLSWHQITLPPGLNLHSRRQQARVRAVLDGLLEEKLLDDPSQLHLALQPNAAAGKSCWVAACNKQWLQNHLQALEASGHPASRIAPEMPPSANPQLWATGEAHNPWLWATGLDENTSLAALPMHGNTPALQALLSKLPAELPVQAEPQLARAAEALQRPVALLTPAQRLFTAIAQPWDLAQFELDLGSNTRLRRRLLDAWQAFFKAPQWRAARWAALIAVVAQLIGLNAWAWKENKDIAQRQQLTKQTLQETFPRIPVIVDAPVQMQRELDLLRSASGALSASDLESLLAASSQIPGIQSAKTLQYQDKQLRIEGLSLDGEALTDAQQSLSSSGYRIERSGSDLLLMAAEAQK